MSIEHATNSRRRSGASRATGVKIRDHLQATYPDVYTPEVLEALSTLAPMNRDQKDLMAAHAASPAAISRGRAHPIFTE